MSCPICGANCRCKKRGASGLCCGCHKHKVRRIPANYDVAWDQAMRASYDQHVEWKRQTDERQCELELKAAG
jgi:hypothetical protein